MALSVKLDAKWPSSSHVLRNNKEKMKTCSNCGKANAPTAKFCGGCGSSLENVLNVEPAASPVAAPTAPLPQALATAATHGRKLPPPRILLQIALIAIAVCCVGKFYFDVVEAAQDYWGWITWLEKGALWIGLCGFAVGCLLKNKIAATVCAVIPVCASIIGAFQVYIIFLPKAWHDMPGFSLVKSLLWTITDFAFFAGLALLAWVAVPHLIAILDDKGRQP